MLGGGRSLNNAYKNLPVLYELQKETLVYTKTITPSSFDQGNTGLADPQGPDRLP